MATVLDAKLKPMTYKEKNDMTIENQLKQLAHYFLMNIFQLPNRFDISFGNYQNFWFHDQVPPAN